MNDLLATLLLLLLALVPLVAAQWLHEQKEEK